MSREQIINMLKEIVEELNYDIYKELFVYEETSYEDLIEIVERHLGGSGSHACLV